MKIDSTALATSSEALSAAVAYREEALAAVQASVQPMESPTDRVTLSPEALAAGDAPPIDPVQAPTSTEEAIADAAVADVAVEAAAKLVQAEDERMASLIFVLAHHGPPLR